METKKATLTVNGYTFYVNYLGPVEAGICRVTLDWDNPKMGYTKVLQEFEFDAFIKCIGFPSDQWNYVVDAHEIFYVPSYGITMVEPEEDVAPPVRDSKHDRWKLTDVASRKLEEFSEEGYLIVRVEHSQDMNEGTLTLHYKKEEA